MRWYSRANQAEPVGYFSPPSCSHVQFLADLQNKPAIRPINSLNIHPFDAPALPFRRAVVAPIPIASSTLVIINAFSRASQKPSRPVLGLALALIEAHPLQAGQATHRWHKPRWVPGGPRPDRSGPSCQSMRKPTPAT